MLSGYKTYILTFIAVITAAANYLVGNADLAATIQLVITAIMGATIRAGVTSTVTKAVAAANSAAK